MSLCRHFGICGGCALQDLAPDDYRARKHKIVVEALARVGLDRVTVEPPLIVPPASRRRAIFKFGKIGGAVDIGFHAARSHSIVDMRECLVLTPGLFGLAQLLRAALTPILKDGEKGEVHAAESESGLDLAFRWNRKLTPALTALLSQALTSLPHGRSPDGGGGRSWPSGQRRPEGEENVARVIVNDEVVLEQRKPQIAFGGARVTLPPHAFLQATAQAEAMLRNKVLAFTAGAKNIADLFAGLGTFTLPLARLARVHAVEQDGAALQALAEAARTTPGLKPVTTEKRDLFKRPLTPPELKSFDAVVLDPPRAGAEAQVRALAASTVPRVAYVSCDAASFARDAAILTAAGFVPGAVTPIDQFLFSLHIELVAGFARPKAKGRGDLRKFWSALLGLVLLGNAPAQANQFANWAVLIVAGDDHAHDGTHAEVFDNARRDLAKAFAGLGFSPANMTEYSVDPAPDAQESKVRTIATGLWDLSTRAPGGCMIYFTSHGAYDKGILVNDEILGPDRFATMVNNACGSKPSVIVMSACFSGQFVPVLAGANRMIFTAARPDRTSFGCGNDLKYTFFDQCFLESLPGSGDFQGAAYKVMQCVAERERKEGMDPPSEPQLAVGKDVVTALRWK